jgi:hypothetical protein
MQFNYIGGTMKVTMLFSLIFLAGCSTAGDYKEYLAAQSAANDQAAKNQKPLLEIEAMEGQSITGLKAVRVFTPTQAPQIQQMRESDFVAALRTVAPIVGTTLGIKYAAQGAVNLAATVGQSNALIAGKIQAPAANITTTTNTTDSHNAVATTTNTATTNTTTSTDSRNMSTNTDSHNIDNSATATPTVVNANPTVVTPTVVQLPPGRVCTISAANVLTCQP